MEIEGTKCSEIDHVRTENCRWPSIYKGPAKDMANAKGRLLR